MFTRLALLFLALALPAYAADGDYLGDASLQAGAHTTEAYLLCDGDHTATDCAEMDLRNIRHPTATQRRGVPDLIQFSIYRQSASCTPTVTITGRAVPTATAGATQVDHSILPAMLGTATSSMSPAVVPNFRVYFATVTADAQCTDLEVIAYLTYFNK